MQLTKQSAAKLQKAYDEAVKKNQTTFIFEGQVVLTQYAKYLLQYIKTLKL